MTLDQSSAEVAQQLREVLRPHLRPRHFAKGSLLWREGETSGMLVALRTGRVKIYRLLPNGRSITLYLFGPGDVFGWLPFIDGEPYPAYAQATEAAEADVMARSTLLQVLRSDPGVTTGLLGLLGRRLREAFDLIESLSTPGARTRVATALLALVPETVVAGRPLVVRFPVSAHEFAEALGLAPETLSRALTNLVEAGVIERVDGGGYRLIDRLALERAGRPAPA